MGCCCCKKKVDEVKIEQKKEETPIDIQALIRKYANFVTEWVV